VKRRAFVLSLLAAGSVVSLEANVSAQRKPTVAPVDPELEKYAKHNLDVGKQYAKRKAWKGAVDRLEEILATYPEYTRIDEVYFVLATCYIELDDVDLARDTYKKLIDERPESEFAKRARVELDKLGETTPH